MNLNNNVRTKAGYYYKKILNQEGKVINNITLIAYCIYRAVKEENKNAPIGIFEISCAFQSFGHRVKPKLILRDGLEYDKYLKNNAVHHKSEDYLTRLIDNVINYPYLQARLVKKGSSWSKTEYKNNLTKECRKILDKLTIDICGGRNPLILTGAVIYLADRLLSKQCNSKLILTQQIISKARRIAEYSIRDHYVNLLKPLFIDSVETNSN